MLKRYSLVLTVCCMAFTHAAGVDISLSGTVKDGAGTAITGAIVGLASDSLMRDTTDDNGEFTIDNTTAIHRSSTYKNSIPFMSRFAIKGSQLSFYIATPATCGSIALFAGDGKKRSEQQLGKMEYGLHQYTLPDLAPGCYVLHVTVNQQTTMFKLVAIGNGYYIDEGNTGGKYWPNREPNGAVASVDTLIVSKAGFPVLKKVIDSYKQTGIAIVMEQQPVYAYSAEVENTCADCTVPDLPDAGQLQKNQKLPDPFKKIDGTPITKKSEWRCRRQEILKQAMKYIYGEKPLKPEVVNGTVTNSKITVHVEALGKKIDFSADIVLPSKGQAPYPAVINLGGKGGFGGMTIGESRVTGEGVAVIYYDYSKVGTEGPDGNARGRENKGLFYDIYGGNHSAGLLAAWAWGASRMIDVLQESGSAIIDTRRLGVTGCSRTAKGAFAVGLFDERIALTLPHETSIGGVPCYRYADANCQENTQNNFNGQLWLSNDFKPFVMNTSQLPIDAHSLIATFAPRGLYIMENPAATQMCAPGGHVSVMGGVEVFKALGAEKSLSYNSNTPGGTGHCSYVNAFTDLLLKNITRFLNHQSAETGKIEAGTSFNKSSWIDWTTPTLEDDTNLYEVD